MHMCTRRCFQRRAGSGWRQWAGSDRTVGSRLANSDGLDVDGLLYPWTDVSTRPRRVYCLSNWLRQACDYTVPPVCCSEEHDSGSRRACEATGRMKEYTQEYTVFSWGCKKFRETLTTNLEYQIKSNYKTTSTTPCKSRDESNEAFDCVIREWLL